MASLDNVLQQLRQEHRHAQIQIEKLKDKDPGFYKYLMENDQELMEFNV